MEVASPMAKAMSEDKQKPGDDDDLPVKSGGGSAAIAPKAGFFRIYKPGQGKITRISTGVAAAGLLALVVQWVHSSVITRVDPASSVGRNIAHGLAVAVAVVGAILVWKLMNSAKGAEFLITTDAEMKKVNWASRRELFGSTRVVILFLFFIGAFLFVADIFSGWFFHFIGVLNTSPFSS